LVLFVIFLSQQRSPCLLMLLQTYSLDREPLRTPALGITADASGKPGKWLWHVFAKKFLPLD
jgi:hypothetical protein